MNDSIDGTLLDYYQRELIWLRQAGTSFAERYPKVAHRLALSGEESSDPHVERLLEGFAFLGARMQRRLDDDFSQLSDALLEQLYPYAIRPMPAVGMVHFTPDPTKGSIASGYTVPRDTPLFVTTAQGDSIHFRTTAATTIWPLQITDVALLPIAEAQALTGLSTACSALRITLTTLAPHSWARLPLRTLRIHLAGSPMTSATLYDLIGAHTLGIFVAVPGEAPQAVLPPLPQPVGFDANEALLPLEDGVLPAHRLLLEYFACPAKFAAFDLPVRIPANATDSIELIVAFDQSLDNHITLQASDIVIGCAPAINLFPRTSEPLRPDGTQREYRVVADSYNPHGIEIYAIRQVHTANNEEASVVPPYFGHHHADQNGGKWWHARRVRGTARDGRGSEMMLTWVDVNFDPHTAPDHTLTASLLCTNRHLADLLAAGTQLAFERPGPVARVTLLGKPTAQADAVLSGASQWRLISQLTLNQLSLVEGAGALAALREMLALYNLNDNPAAQRQIAGIHSLDAQRTVAHTGNQAWRGWRNGLELRVGLSTEHFAGASRVLFSGVLAHFLAQYASVNRFVRTVLVEQDRDIKIWQPLVGDPLIL